MIGFRRARIHSDIAVVFRILAVAMPTVFTVDLSWWTQQAWRAVSSAGLVSSFGSVAPASPSDVL